MSKEELVAQIFSHQETLASVEGNWTTGSGQRVSIDRGAAWWEDGDEWKVAPKRPGVIQVLDDDGKPCYASVDGDRLRWDDGDVWVRQAEVASAAADEGGRSSSLRSRGRAATGSKADVATRASLLTAPAGAASAARLPEGEEEQEEEVEVEEEVVEQAEEDEEEEEKPEPPATTGAAEAPAATSSTDAPAAPCGLGVGDAVTWESTSDNYVACQSADAAGHDVGICRGDGRGTNNWQLCVGEPERRCPGSLYFVKCHELQAAPGGATPPSAAPADLAADAELAPAAPHPTLAEPEPEQEPADEPAQEESPAECQDSDNGAVVVMQGEEFDCEIYSAHPIGCLAADFYDDSDFTAELMCCGCGGGLNKAPAESRT